MPKGQIQAPSITARKMEELAAKFLVAGCTASEFARRHGLTRGQTDRMSAMASAVSIPPAQTLQKAGEISVRVSGMVLGTVEAIAIKSQKALETAAAEWKDGEIPDLPTLKRLQSLANLLTLPLRFQRKETSESPGDPGAMRSINGN